MARGMLFDIIEKFGIEMLPRGCCTTVLTFDTDSALAVRYIWGHHRGQTDGDWEEVGKIHPVPLPNTRILHLFTNYTQGLLGVEGS